MIKIIMIVTIVIIVIRKYNKQDENLSYDEERKRKKYSSHDYLVCLKQTYQSISNNKRVLLQSFNHSHNQSINQSFIHSSIQSLMKYKY